MATIQTSIMIEDRMSRQFAAMNMAMISVIDSFEQLESVSGNAIDTTALRQARTQLQGLEASFNQVEQEILQSERAQESFNRDLRTSNQFARNLLGKITAIAGTYLSLQGMGNLINTSDEMTNTTARIDLLVSEMPVVQQDLSQMQLPLTTDVDVNLKTDTAALADLSSNLSQVGGQIPVDYAVQGLSDVELAQQLIYESAKRSYSSFKDTADLVTRIGMNAGDAFGSTAEVIAFSELVQKQFGIAGASATEASNATLQLSQALASGVLRGDELNSIFEQAPNLIHSIANYMGEPIGRIRELAKDGQITADIVKNAMFAAANDINNKFDSMPVTWAQLWTNFKTDALWAFKDVLSYINSVANSDRMSEFLGDIKNKLSIVADFAIQTMSVIGSIGAFIYDNWSAISPVVTGVSIALGGLATALTAVWVAKMTMSLWTAISTTAMILYATATGAGTGATWSMVAAAWGLNAALAANPVFLIVMGIMLLIGVVYAAVGAYNHFADESISATGLIAGAIAVAGAFIANVLFGLLGIVLGIVEALYNRWIAFANFFGNVFNDPVASIIRLFGDLGDNVLGVIEKIANAIDFVFGSNLAGAVAGWRSELAGLVNWAAEEYGNGSYEVLYEELDTDKVLQELGVTLDRFEYGDVWDSAYKWGEDLFGKEQETKDKQITDSYDDLAALSGLGDMATALDDLKTPGKDTAKNTKKLADSATILADDLKYMRDLADRDAINRYTTRDIKIDVKNENHINNEMDLDGMIDKFAEKLEEAVDITAEGAEVDV